MFGVTSLNEKESFLSDIPRSLNHVWINRWVNTIRHGPSLTGKLCGLGPWGCFFFLSLSILFLFAKIDQLDPFSELTLAAMVCPSHVWSRKSFEVSREHVQQREHQQG